ncbi:DUF3576 domain-containing protein [Alphaproteobacteria bacterium]|nr:DUF3576 domain-containing protein [Alphaproteobacteria bacterium]
MKKLLLIITLFLFVTGCAGIGKNFQEVKKREMESDPCKYERQKGPNAVERCEARVKTKGSPENSNNGFFDSMLDQLRAEGSLGSGQNVAVNKWLWNGSIETLQDFPLKIADAFGGVIETDWINNKDIPNQRCAIKVLIQSKELISNGVSANMICQSFDGKNWTLNNEDLSDANRDIENSILSLARKSFLTFAG